MKKQNEIRGLESREIKGNTNLLEQVNNSESSYYSGKFNVMPIKQ